MQVLSATLQLLSLELSQKLDQKEGHLDHNRAFCDAVKLIFKLFSFFCTANQRRHKMVGKRLWTCGIVIVLAGHILKVNFSYLLNLVLGDH